MILSTMRLQPETRPNDVKKALKTLQHYVSFGGNLLDGVQTTT